MWICWNQLINIVQFIKNKLDTWVKILLKANLWKGVIISGSFCTTQQKLQPTALEWQNI